MTSLSHPFARASQESDSLTQSQRFAKRPVVHLVQLAISIFAGTLVLAAQAQSVPPGSAYGYLVTGLPGFPGQGDKGVGQNGGASPDATGNFGYTGSFNETVFGMVSTGGVGGTGATGGNDSGGGGNGGAGGALQGSFTGGAITGTSTSPTLLITSTGGNGGVPGTMNSELGTPGGAGSGGAGGSVTFTDDQGANSQINATQGWNGSTAGATAVLLQSTGGNGGAPSTGAQSLGSVDGPVGGSGGAAGNITATLGSTSIQSQGSGLVAISQGGAGNTGTMGTGGVGQGAGGNGGVGGAGGGVTINVNDGVAIGAVGASTAATGTQFPIDAAGNPAQASSIVAGLLAQSLGGVGGAGGQASGVKASAGSGGAAGAAGTVFLGTSGSLQISTRGYSAPGLVEQSIGGAGGSGALAGGAFSSSEGNGAPGGNAGTVYAAFADKAGGTGFISTAGPDSAAVILQSIGGGGGVGGSVQTGSAFASIALGGKGKSGGDGNAVALYNGQAAKDQPGYVIKTTGNNSSALVAQSIGGGGGSGGSAGSTAIGVLNYAVGGSAGNGGNAGTPGSTGTTWVTAENNGLVSTSGDHSDGLVAQAVGGGGGMGGAAAALASSTELGINVSVGGNGGKGGDGGNVQATNSQQILTSGADSWGVIAQSVGGGGGNGGSSKADSWDLAAPGPVPNLSVDVSVGGTGGTGGVSGNTTGTNNGLIMTSGAGAHGMIVQSIGGGGGNGGDSSALNEAIGTGDTLKVTVNVGGSGGGGGTGGNVTATNAAGGLIWTIGDSARGIFAQSVSGGGGSGGTAKTDSDFLKKVGAGGQTYNITLGGTGGGGGDSTTVTVNNAGNIMTMGNTSDAIFAQSVGGGGGLGGQATAAGAGGKNTANLTVGGASGTASNGGTVNVTNSGNIYTRGGNSAGIYAQSVGGGGGKAGTPTTGGDTAAAMSVQSFLADSSMAAYTTTYADGTVGWKPGAFSNLSEADLQQLAKLYRNANAKNSPPANSDPDTQSAQDALLLGNGTTDPTKQAAFGSGGMVIVTNSGQIQTSGPLASGIWAQSVGGGGGDIGTTHVAATTNGALTGHDTTASVGGTGFNAGNGGNVPVSNTGQIATAGDASYGILAQSVGAGGGHAATTDSVNAGTSGTLAVTIGGGGNVHGNGGDVSVQSVNGGSATIATTGNDAVGILAQSVGGGGGVMAVMHTGTSADGNPVGVTTASGNPGTGGPITRLTIGNPYVGPVGPNDPPSNLPQCNGQLVSSCGNGGTVYVFADVISTQGRDAHGILAQSIGGSGGTLIGATPQAGNPFVNRSTTLGNGDYVSVTVNNSVTTRGDGAYGVLAQNIGGGGLLAGDLSTMTSTTPFPAWTGNEDPTSKFLQGNGGPVTVTVANNATVHTTGANAHAIFAQSVGGGGGLVTTTGGTYMGSMGGSGTAGAIKVDVNPNATVQADGAGASAIYTNSEGQSGGTSSVLVQNNGTIIGNASAAAIQLTGNGNSNGNGSVANSGFLLNPGGNAVAVLGNDNQNRPSYADVTNNGTITGNLQLGSRGVLNNNYLWNLNGSSTVGQVNNATGAALNLGPAMTSYAPTHVVAGNLTSSGNILTTMDFSGQTSSWVQFYGGTAQLNGGQVSVTIPSGAGLAPNALPVLEADNGIALSPSVTAVNAANSSVSYAISTSVQDGIPYLMLTPTTQFAAIGARQGYSANQASLAQHLDAGFAKNMTPEMSRVYGRLAGMDGAHVQSSMDALGNEAVQSVGVARLTASQDFVERMNSCPQFGTDGMQLKEQDCLWSRAMNNNAKLDGSTTRVGYDANASKFQIGGQKGIGNDWFVGGSIGYDNTSAIASQSSVKGTGWTAALIAKKQLGDWTFSGAVDAGTGSYDSQRQVQLGDAPSIATASFNASHVGLHGRIAHQFAMDGWYLRPYVDMHAVHLRTGAYSETGAGALNLKVNSASDTLYTVTPMLEAGTLFNLGNGMQLRGYVSGGIAYSNQNAWTASASLQGSVPQAGTFQTTSKLPNQRAKINLGADLIATKNLDIRLEYTGEFASGFRSNGAMLKAAYSF